MFDFFLLFSLKFHTNHNTHNSTHWPNEWKCHCKAEKLCSPKFRNPSQSRLVRFVPTRRQRFTSIQFCSSYHGLIRMCFINVHSSLSKSSSHTNHLLEINNCETVLICHSKLIWCASVYQLFRKILLKRYADYRSKKLILYSNYTTPILFTFDQILIFYLIISNRIISALLCQMSLPIRYSFEICSFLFQKGKKR